MSDSTSESILSPSSMISMSLTAALQSLPHGPSFRFVDELLSLEPGRSATGTYLLRGDEAFLAGHFPMQPIMPAVLMVEAIAQVAGIAAQTDPEIPALPDLRLSSIRGIKIYGAAVPKETLHIEATVQGRMGNLVQASGKVSIGGKLMAEGQVTLSGG